MLNSKKDDLYIYIIVGIFSGIGMLFLLIVNHFFCNFSSQVFNNAVAPLLLFFTLIIMYLQLRNTSSNEEYKVYKEDLKDRENIFKEIKFTPKNIQTYNPHLLASIKESNGINYHNFFFESDFVRGKKQLEPDTIHDFRYNFLFPLVREYIALLDLLCDINENKLLTSTHKMRLYKKVEMNFLQDYFRICNNTIFGSEKKEYDLSRYYTITFKQANFEAINNFYKDNELFQYQSLNFYKIQVL